MEIEAGDFVRVFGYNSQKQYLKGRKIFRVRSVSGKPYEVVWNEMSSPFEHIVCCESCEDSNKSFHVAKKQCVVVGKKVK